MVVVADTSPINYLLLIREIQLLQILFGTVVIPPAVVAELCDDDAPEVVRLWMTNAPRWIEQRGLIQPPRPEIMGLDDGEREAIELALQLEAGLILIDESKGRLVATELHLEVRGTIGILIQAAQAGLVDLAKALDKLEATSFHITPALRKSAMRFYNPEGRP